MVADAMAGIAMLGGALAEQATHLRHRHPLACDGGGDGT